MARDRFLAAIGRLTLGSVALMLSAPSAYAQNFDLDCFQLDAEGQKQFGLPPDHYQIDRSKKQWCRDKCDAVQPTIKDDNAVIILEDGEFYGDRRLIEFDADTGLLVNSFAAGTQFELIRRYQCEKQEFGGLQPYLAERPRPKGGIPISKQDFLLTDKGKQIGGIVTFEIGVAADGALLKCDVISSSGNLALDAHSCNLAMQRLRLSPAKNRAGQPIESKYQTRIRWYADND